MHDEHVGLFLFAGTLLRVASKGHQRANLRFVPPILRHAHVVGGNQAELPTILEVGSPLILSKGLSFRIYHYPFIWR